MLPDPPDSHGCLQLFDIFHFFHSFHPEAAEAVPAPAPVHFSMTNELRIYTQINSRYQVFDASGQLPFSIVFGLCRRSSADTDPRPLLLKIVGSVLDVPYALIHGLLTLHKQDPEDAEQWVEVDLSRLDQIAAKETECLSLPSPVSRTERWRDAVTVYQCHVHVDSELASILEPGKKYRIRLASKDLGVKRWAHSDRKQFVDNDGKPNRDSETVKLVNSKPTGGNATFRVVKSLCWPPRMETRICLCTSSPSSDSALANTNLSSSAALEVSVINTGSDSVTVQPRGHQRFVTPWGPFQPEPDADDGRIRIIDATPHQPSSLQVVDSMTGGVVREYKQSSIGPLMDSNADRRPKAEYLVILKPGAPIIRKIDIGALVDGLVDGQYKVRMQSKGCRWWHGEVGKEGVDDGRAPAHSCGKLICPLMLESQDEVELCIKDGKVGQSV